MSDVSRLLRGFYRALPVSVPLCGLKRNATLAVFDRLFRSSAGTYRLALASEGVGDGLELAHENPNERLLKYAYWNVRRYFVRSGLGQIIQGEAWDAGKTFVDIGANLGLYSMLAKRAGATTVCFEPEPVHFAFLARNRAFFDHAFNLALCAVDGTAAFHVGTYKNPGCSSLVSSDAGRDAYYYERTIDVPTQRWDTFLAEHPEVRPETIAGIKIDVEGAEVETLKGMQDFLPNAGAWIWTEACGSESDRARNSYRGIIGLLSDAGYDAWVMKKGMLRPFDERRDVETVFDLFFARPEHHGALLAAFSG